jgi:hypothetical protein
MRIDKGQKIVGHPALKIRRIIREAARHHLTPQRAQEILCCSDSSARKVIRDLEAEGFMESVKGRLEVSIKGNALAMARTAAPLRCQTAERLIADVVNRAHSVNRDEKWAYRVMTLVLFGSCARGEKRPNDVDVACELAPRFDGERQSLLEQDRRAARGEEFRNLSQWASWPRMEVFQFLKSRARGLSLHQLDAWVLGLANRRVIFRDESANQLIESPEAVAKALAARQAAEGKDDPER